MLGPGHGAERPARSPDSSFICLLMTERPEASPLLTLTDAMSQHSPEGQPPECGGPQERGDTDSDSR